MPDTAVAPPPRPSAASAGSGSQGSGIGQVNTYVALIGWFNVILVSDCWIPMIGWFKLMLSSDWLIQTNAVFWLAGSQRSGLLWRNQCHWQRWVSLFVIVVATFQENTEQT